MVQRLKKESPNLYDRYVTHKTVPGNYSEVNRGCGLNTEKQQSLLGIRHTML